MSKELNCMNCCIGDFKNNLCDCNNGICKEYKKIGRSEDFEKEVLKRTKEVVRCKDCKHKYVSGNGTTQYYVCDFMDAQYEEDGFCHHGEREVEK